MDLLCLKMRSNVGSDSRQQKYLANNFCNIRPLDECGLLRIISCIYQPLETYVVGTQKELSQ